MNTLEHFRLSFAYNDWANGRIVEALKESRGNIMLKIRDEGFTPPAIDYIIYLREI